MINEIKRLRIGFKSFEPAVNATPYALLETQRATLTFALEESSKGRQWVYLGGSTYFNSTGPALFGYMKGYVWEAEIGKRLVLGKRLSAEQYLSGIKSTPVVDLSNLPGVSLTVQMEVDAARRDRLMQDDGYTFDAQTCSMVERGGKLDVSVPIVNHNNLMLALFMWTATEKIIHLTVDDVADQRSLGHLSTAPIGGETLDMF